MASTQTARLKMREICLSLPETVETEHFGEPCFRVGKRIFASCGEKAGKCRLVFQPESDHASQLVNSDPRFERYTRQQHCVSLDVANVENWAEVRALVLESYRLNAPADPVAKRTRAASRKKSPQKRKAN